MQIGNSFTPSFKGFISPGTKDKAPMCYTNSNQDELIKTAADYFLDGENEVVLSNNDSKTFSDIINQALGKVFFKNDVPKKIERFSDDIFIYHDAKDSGKPVEGCLFCTEA
jgi:hypothetical protein